jgi:hypothetical protein
MVIISNLKTFHLQHDMRVKLFSLPFLLQSITPIEHLTMSFTTKLNSLFSRRWRRRKLGKKGDDSKASQTIQILVTCPWKRDGGTAQILTPGFEQRIRTLTWMAPAYGISGLPTTRLTEAFLNGYSTEQKSI